MKGLKEHLDLIDETVKYYTEDTSRRALSGDVCHYFFKGEMCAVGRCLKEPQLFEAKVKTIPDTGIDNLVKEGFSIEFKDEYNGYGDWFWRELQVLHDNQTHWTEEGLTKKGLGFVEHLKDFCKGVVK